MGRPGKLMCRSEIRHRELVMLFATWLLSLGFVAVEVVDCGPAAIDFTQVVDSVEIDFFEYNPVDCFYNVRVESQARCSDHKRRTFSCGSHVQGLKTGA